MSDSDDTDVLLLIPPDFFTVRSSDSEESDLSFQESFICTQEVKELLDTERKVIDDLIFHVNSLEDRILTIESNSLSSELIQLDESLRVLSSAYASNVILVNENSSQNLFTCQMKSQISDVGGGDSVKPSHYTQPTVSSIQKRKPRSVPGTPKNRRTSIRSVDINISNSLPNALPNINWSPKDIQSDSELQISKHERFRSKTNNPVPFSMERINKISEAKGDLRDNLSALDKYFENMSNQQMLIRNARVPVPKEYERERQFACGDDIRSVPDLRFGLRDFTSLPVNEEIIKPKAVLPLGSGGTCEEGNVTPRRKYVDLMEMEALLLEMQKTQHAIESNMERNSRVYHLDGVRNVNKDDAASCVSSRFGEEGDSGSSLTTATNSYDLKESFSDLRVIADDDRKRPIDEELYEEYKMPRDGSGTSVRIEQRPGILVNQVHRSNDQVPQSPSKSKNTETPRRRLQFENEPYSVSQHVISESSNTHQTVENSQNCAEGGKSTVETRPQSSYSNVSAVSSVIAPVVSQASIDNTTTPFVSLSDSEHDGWDARMRLLKEFNYNPSYLHYSFPKLKDSHVVVTDSLQGRPQTSQTVERSLQNQIKRIQAASSHRNKEESSRDQQQMDGSTIPISSADTRKDNVETPSKKKVDFVLESVPGHTQNLMRSNSFDSKYISFLSLFFLSFINLVSSGVEKSWNFLLIREF